MRSSRKSETRDGPPERLVPLHFSHDSHFSQFIETVEPNKQRSDLIWNAKNSAIFDDILKEFRNGDVLRRHGISNRTKLLFCGPPGCGKTVSAEAIASQLGLPLYVARIEAIISSFLGETASNIKKLFDTANRHTCVLFLDEFDALARARSDRGEHNELRRVVNSLLMMIDRYKGRGLLIAATNLEESLDTAVWRRFDEVILFDLPELSEIREFLKLKTRNFFADFDLQKKAVRLKGLSFAEIERVCMAAIKQSIMNHRSRISEQEFDAAISDEARRQKIRTRVKGRSRNLR
jgi:SpoVK/Ycf46/Vps4 family AAA+-type ATPase